MELHKTACIPILHWEEIEQILEKQGYDIQFERLELHFKCGIGERESRFYKVIALGKTRHEAVYRAVVMLGKRDDSAYKDITKDKNGKQDLK